MNKLSVHLKGNQKPIIISDNSDSDLEGLIEQTKEIFNSENIFQINTGSDCLIGRPSEIQAIMITAGTKEKKNDSRTDS